jgi:hypothetical protein
MELFGVVFGFEFIVVLIEMELIYLLIGMKVFVEIFEIYLIGAGLEMYLFDVVF